MTSRKTSMSILQDCRKDARNKAEKKARERVYRRAIEEERRRRYQKAISFDSEGNRIGDDGYPMTKARWRFHYLCNGMFVLMVVAFLLAVVMIAASFFQGQQLTPWELVAYGGNQFHGYSAGNLLRIEALYLLFLTALCLLINMKGMAWLYDGASVRPVKTSTGVLGIFSFGYFLIECVVIRIFDPFSFIAWLSALAMIFFVRAVAQERPYLRKAQVASKVIKK